MRICPSIPSPNGPAFPGRPAKIPSSHPPARPPARPPAQCSASLRYEVEAVCYLGRSLDTIGQALQGQAREQHLTAAADLHIVPPRQPTIRSEDVRGRLPS